MKFTYKCVTAACLAAMFTAASVVAAETAGEGAGGADSSDSSGTVSELTSGNFALEYMEITYSGGEQKPEIVTDLVPETDFIVEYPEDCVSAGEKTITIRGTGGYSGEVKLVYKVLPLDVMSADIAVTFPGGCVYDGSEQRPVPTVTFNGKNLREGTDFTTEYSNNVNATTDADKAKCVLSFTGNFTGTRTMPFVIEKAPVENREIELKANPGRATEFDISALKPAGAMFGTPSYDAADFDSANTLKISFNVLRFTLNSGGDSEIRVPVTKQRNFKDYELIFTVKSAEKPVPRLVIPKISKDYDGARITSEDLAKSGYAELDGKRIDGAWSLIDEPPVMPGDYALRVKFTPIDSALEPALGVASVNIAKLRVWGLAVNTSSHAEIGESVTVTVSGVPKDYNGEIRVKSSGEGAEGFSLTRKSDTEYTAKFPDEDALYTFTAELVGDEIYAAQTAEFTVRVGDAELPEEQKPEHVTTDAELAEMVVFADEGAEIAAEGCKTIPAEIVKAAADKRLTLRVRMNDSYTWVIRASELTRPDALNLSLTPAVIPYVLRERIGGDTSASFNVFAGNLGKGASLEVTTAKYEDGVPRFANLFLYNTDGELKFVSCNRVENGKSALAISKRGKYVVLTDTETKMPGDLNSDMRINAKDATDVLKITVGIIKERNPKGDVNGDGLINAADATEILRHTVGLPSTLDN